MRNEILVSISRAIAASNYPYSGPALVCLPNGDQVTREDYWNTLSATEKERYLQYAYAAYTTIADYGMKEVMYQATQDYLSEK